MTVNAADQWSGLLVLSGPSGVGKGTVIAEMLERSRDVWLSVSATTREPRPGEVDGVDYFYVSDEEFHRQVAADGFLEWAEYAGNHYGTLKAPVLSRLAAGQRVLLEIDLAGARQIRASHPTAVFVFLAPPSEAELRRRLAHRGTETPETAERRLARAADELRAAGEFDHVVTNSDVSTAAEELLQLWDRRRA